MIKNLLEELGRVIAKCNPLLSERLLPGLSETEAKRFLSEAPIHGRIDAVVNLYTWRNGTLWGDPTFFPRDGYDFLGLPDAIEKFEEIKTTAADLKLMETPKAPFATVFGDLTRYFPVFADGAGGYLEIDLAVEGRNGVALFAFAEGAPREVYASFEEFLRDVIRSYQENEPLRLFRGSKSND